MFRTTLAAAVVVGLVGGLIGAGYADTMGPFNSVIPTSTAEGGTFTFPEFDSSLGTLTQVELTLGSTWDTTLTVINESDSPWSGIAGAQLLISVYGLSSFGLGGGGYPSFGPDQLTLHSPSSPFSAGPGDSVQCGPLTQSGATVLDYTDEGTLGVFTGAGDVPLSVGTMTIAGVSVLPVPPGDGGFTQTGDAGFEATVTYSYTPATVPEPGTLWLFVVGAVGVGLRLAVRRG